MDEESGGLIDAASPSKSKDFFPMSIVWSPIPMLTWLLPVSGHLGFSDSSGMVKRWPLYLVLSPFFFVVSSCLFVPRIELTDDT